MPSLLFFIFLLYSLPRTRQKLSGAPVLFTAIYWMLHITTISGIVRALLMFMAPSPNSDLTSAAMEKVTWALVHGTNMCLEMSAFLIFFLAELPSTRSSHRLLTITAVVSALSAVIMSIIETHGPSQLFHVSRLNLDTYLFGDGGPVFTLLFSLVSAVAYSSLISMRVFQKSGARRSSTFTYSVVMLGIQGTRTLGAILLNTDVEVININENKFSAISFSVRNVSDGPDVFPPDPVRAPAGVPLRALPLPPDHPKPQLAWSGQQFQEPWWSGDH